MFLIEKKKRDLKNVTYAIPICISIIELCQMYSEHVASFLFCVGTFICREEAQLLG